MNSFRNILHFPGRKLLSRTLVLLLNSLFTKASAHSKLFIILCSDGSKGALPARSPPPTDQNFFYFCRDFQKMLIKYKILGRQPQLGVGAPSWTKVWIRPCCSTLQCLLKSNWKTEWLIFFGPCPNKASHII